MLKLDRPLWRPITEESNTPHPPLALAQGQHTGGTKKKSGVLLFIPAVVEFQKNHEW